MNVVIFGLLLTCATAFERDAEASFRLRVAQVSNREPAASLNLKDNEKDAEGKDAGGMDDVQKKGEEVFKKNMVIVVVISIVSLMIVCVASYFVYKWNTDMKAKKQTPRCGMYSVLCCVCCTPAACHFCGPCFGSLFYSLISPTGIHYFVAAALLCSILMH